MLERIDNPKSPAVHREYIGTFVDGESTAPPPRCSASILDRPGSLARVARMKAVIQRVARGSVTINGEVCGRIDRGYVILLGVRTGDTADDARYLAQRTVNLRIFADAQDRMNLSVVDIDGDILVISQFTLYADTRKGNRPSFIRAGDPKLAETLYEAYVAALRRELGEARVQTGRFAASMEVEIINDGPVTIELTTDK